MHRDLRQDSGKCSFLRNIKSNYNYRLCGDKRNLVTRADCEAIPGEFAAFENNFKDNVLGCTLHQAIEGKEFGLFRRQSIRSDIRPCFPI